MSERSYFSLRLAIPGYTFILLLVVLNYLIWIQSLKVEEGVPEFSDLFFGFLALLSGSGIGFSLSQIWNVLSDRLCLSYGRNEPRKHLRSLINLYGLSEPLTNDDERNIIVVYSYILNTQAGKRSEVVGYTTRRWDLYNLFGSEIVSLTTGLVVGWGIRLVANKYLPGKDFTFWKVQHPWNATEFWVLLLTSLAAVIFVGIMMVRMRRVDSQYNSMAEALIRDAYYSGDVKRKDLENIFPRSYFSWPLTVLEGIREESVAKLKEVGIHSVSELSKYSIEEDPSDILGKGFSKQTVESWIAQAKGFLKG